MAWPWPRPKSRLSHATTGAAFAPAQASLPLSPVSRTHPASCRSWPRCCQCRPATSSASLRDQIRCSTLLSICRTGQGAVCVGSAQRSCRGHAGARPGRSQKAVLRARHRRGDDRGNRRRRRGRRLNRLRPVRVQGRHPARPDGSGDVRSPVPVRAGASGRRRRSGAAHRASASVARAIYESESRELALLRGASSFSPDLRQLEGDFEQLRLEMQGERIELLFARSMRARGWSWPRRDESCGCSPAAMSTGCWSRTAVDPDQYQTWLARTLVEALVAVEHRTPD